MEARAPFYNEISDLVVSTEQRGASGVVREIISKIESL